MDLLSESMGLQGERHVWSRKQKHDLVTRAARFNQKPGNQAESASTIPELPWQVEDKFLAREGHVSQALCELDVALPSGVALDGRPRFTFLCFSLFLPFLSFLSLVSHPFWSPFSHTLSLFTPPVLPQQK